MARRPRFRFLNENDPELNARPVPVDRVFVLKPPVFKPLADQPCLDDGEPPTAVGRAAIVWWCRAHGCDPRSVPTGFVRAIEAISATPDNAEAIGKARIRRNHAGTFHVAQLEVLVPAVRGATVQPRMASKGQRKMREKYGQSLIHEVGDGLVIAAESAEHLINITDAQWEVGEPSSYVGQAEKDFIDSLALEGIREEMRGFVFDIRTDDGQQAHIVETDDGWTRATVAKATMGQLMGVNADLSTMHWEDPDGGLTVRSFTPAAIRALHEALRFPAATFQVWPEQPTDAAIRGWVGEASPAALANIRMMTARMDIGIAVRPYSGSSDHDVVYADMARFHVRGHTPTLWGKADDEAFKARSLINDLVRHGYVTEEQRAVWFGDVVVPWWDDPGRRPFRNRVVATTAVMIATTVDDPAAAGRYPQIRSALKRLQIPNSPTQASVTTAALAGLTAGLDGDGEMGQFTAMVSRSFKKAELREIGEQPGNWTEQIDQDLSVLADAARAELAAGSDRTLGPNQRALAILAMVAHGANKALRDYRRPDASGTAKTYRWPSSMTLTGRGGRGGVRTVEADVIMFNAARSPDGIDELAAIVAATTSAEPVVPIRPSTGEEMLEEWLRHRWERGSGGATGRQADEDGTDDGPAEHPPVCGSRLSDPGEWSGAVTTLVDRIAAIASESEGLAEVPVGMEDSGLPEDEYDPDDENLDRMIDTVGVDTTSEKESDEALEQLRQFFRRGLRGYARRGKL